MSANDPRLPGAGITFRILRDDGVTYAGVTMPGELFSIAAARAKLAAATGLSAGEITRANAISFPGMHSPREPVRQGAGWCSFSTPAGISAYVLRDDASHLSYTAMPANYSTPGAQTALNATASLSAAEQARIAAIA